MAAYSAAARGMEGAPGLDVVYADEKKDTFFNQYTDTAQAWQLVLVSKLLSKLQGRVV